MSGHWPAPLVEFDDAVFAYDGGPVAAEADLAVPAGAMVGLVGPSGAGKTTLLRALLGQLRPRRGEVRVGGEEEPVVVEHHHLGAEGGPQHVGREHLLGLPCAITTLFTQTRKGSVAATALRS